MPTWSVTLILNLTFTLTQTHTLVFTPTLTPTLTLAFERSQLADKGACD